MVITFTEEGKRILNWEAGRTWGLRLYQIGLDQGLLFTIKWEAWPLGDAHAIGPLNRPRPTPFLTSLLPQSKRVTITQGPKKNQVTPHPLRPMEEHPEQSDPAPSHLSNPSGSFFGPQLL